MGKFVREISPRPLNRVISGLKLVDSCHIALRVTITCNKVVLPSLLSTRASASAITSLFFIFVRRLRTRKAVSEGHIHAPSLSVLEELKEEGDYHQMDVHTGSTSASVATITLLYLSDPSPVFNVECSLK